MIASRRHPFASIDRHLADRAHLQLVRLMYDVESELRMKPGPHEKDKGVLRVQGCTYTISFLLSCTSLNPDRQYQMTDMYFYQGSQ